MAFRWFSDELTRRRSDFTMHNLNQPEDVEKKLDRLNVQVGVIADCVADIAERLETYYSKP